MKTYHNTTELSGDELKQAIDKAVSQDDKVLIYFRNNADKEFTPSEVHKEIFPANVPLTSVRRALSNLTRKGYLEKTDNQKTGVYGRPEYTWQLFNWDLTKS